MLSKGHAERLIQRRHGAMQLVAEAEAEGEGVALAQIDLGGQRDVAVGRGGELIVHLEVGVRSCHPSVLPT